MAHRWATLKELGQLRSLSLFSRFAGRLRTIHATYSLDMTSRINTHEPLYEYVAPPRTMHTRHWVSPSDLAASLEQGRMDGNFSLRSGHSDVQSQHVVGDDPGQINVPSTTYDPQLDARWANMHVAQDGDPSQDQDYSDLIAISQSLLDPDFAGMDRIVNFDDVMMGDQTESWNMA